MINRRTILQSLLGFLGLSACAQVAKPSKTRYDTPEWIEGVAKYERRAKAEEDRWLRLVNRRIAELNETDDVKWVVSSVSSLPVRHNHRRIWVYREVIGQASRSGIETQVVFELFLERTEQEMVAIIDDRINAILRIGNPPFGFVTYVPPCDY